MADLAADRAGARPPVPDADLDELLAEIAQVQAEARGRDDLELHRRLLRLRHHVGILLTTTPGRAPGFAAGARLRSGPSGGCR